MNASTTGKWLLVSFLALVAAVWLRPNPLSTVLVAASVGSAGWVAATLAHPWLGVRSCYRVRYHSAEDVSIEGRSLVRVLCSMAQGNSVSIVWQRHDGHLTLFMEVPKQASEVLRGMLPRLLPQVIVEPVGALPTLSLAQSAGKSGIYRWLLAPAGTGNREDDPFAFERLCSDDVFVGDFEMRVNLVPYGAKVIVYGTPNPVQRMGGIRPLYRPLWRYLTLRAACEPSRPGKEISAGEIAVEDSRVMAAGDLPTNGKAQRAQRVYLRRAGLPSFSDLMSRVRTLLGRYPLWEEWPRATGQGGGPETMMPSMCFPATNTADTARLDSRNSSVIALSGGLDRHDPRCERTSPERSATSLFMGVTSADNRPVHVPLTESGGSPGQVWRAHFIVAGGTDAEREATVSMFTDQVVQFGGGMVLLDPVGEKARRLAAQLSPSERSRRHWVDTQNPAGSLRLNLLAVPPLPPVLGRQNRAGGEAAALLVALSECVPLLGEYLSHIGVSTSSMWGTRGGSNLLLDWARVLLVAHHRARIEGGSTYQQAGYASNTRDAEYVGCAGQAPDVRTLFELLDETERLPTLVQREMAEWESGRASGSKLLAEQLRLAGEEGTAATELARQTLSEVRERLGSTSRAELRLLAAGLRDQLRPAMHHPALSRLWRGPFEAPATLLNQAPGALLLARLPVSGVARADATAARWYGQYLLGCVAAAGKWRIKSMTSSPPVLLLLEGASVWLSGGNALESRMGALGNAGIAVLATDAKLYASGPDSGNWLLEGAGTWWVHSLNSSTRGANAIRKRLARLGVSEDFSLSNLSTGVAVLKFPTPEGEAAATVYTGREQAHRAYERSIPSNSLIVKHLI